MPATCCLLGLRPPTAFVEPFVRDGEVTLGVFGSGAAFCLALACSVCEDGEAAAFAGTLALAAARDWASLPGVVDHDAGCLGGAGVCDNEGGEDEEEEEEEEEGDEADAGARDWGCLAFGFGFWF